MRRRDRCVKKGHKWRRQVRRGHTTTCNGLGFRCVADRVTQEREACRRCGLATEWDTVWSHCLNGLAMDPRSWETLRREGFLPE